MVSPQVIGIALAAALLVYSVRGLHDGFVKLKHQTVCIAKTRHKCPKVK